MSRRIVRDPPGRIRIDRLSAKGRLAAFHGETRNECRREGSRVKGLVDDFRKVAALADEVSDNVHRPLSRIAELEYARIVDDSEVDGVRGFFRNLFRGKLGIERFACRTGIGFDDVCVAQVPRIADVMVDVACPLRVCDAFRTFRPDAVNGRRVEQKGEFEGFSAVFAFDVFCVAKEPKLFGERFEKDLDGCLRVVVLDIAVKAETRTDGVSVGVDMGKYRNGFRLPEHFVNRHRVPLAEQVRGIRVFFVFGKFASVFRLLYSRKAFDLLRGELAAESLVSLDVRKLREIEFFLFDLVPGLVFHGDGRLR